VTTRQIWTWAAIVFLAAFILYRISPQRQVFDARYTVLEAESLYRFRTFELAHRIDNTAPLPYQLQPVAGHVYYTYPPGTALLTLPLVMACNALGMRAIGSDGHYDPRGEDRIQRWIAPLLAALAAALLTRLVLAFTTGPRAAALIIALVLGSSLWSTASRALWSQTTEATLLAAALVMLVTRRPTGRWTFGLALGSLLGWMFIARPLAAISIAAILACLAAKDRPRFWPTAATALAWLAMFIAWSWSLYHAWRPPYYDSALSLTTFFQAAAGVMVSPGRGLLLFSPWIAAVVTLLVIHRKQLPRRALLSAGLAAIGAQWLVVASWPMWWMGHCFGPRAFLDVLPWIALLAAAALQAIPPGAIRRGPALCGCLLVGFGVLVHFQGAWLSDAIAWNVLPANVDTHPERLWDWRNPQFAAGIRGTLLRHATPPAPRPQQQAPIDAAGTHR
jgi:hypothetical protein